MKSLASVTKRLASRHAKHKKADKLLKESKADFHKLVDAEVEKVTNPRRKVVQSNIPEFTRAQEVIEQYNPGWLVEASVRVIDPGAEWSFTLVENPEFAPFTYVNKDLGMVFSRSIQPGEALLDDKRLKEEDPDLWDRVTVEIRALVDLADLSPEDAAAVQEYLYSGKPVRKVNSPRKAKPEELS